MGLAVAVGGLSFPCTVWLDRHSANLYGSNTGVEHSVSVCD